MSASPPFTHGYASISPFAISSNMLLDFIFFARVSYQQDYPHTYIHNIHILDTYVFPGRSTKKRKSLNDKANARATSNQASQKRNRTKHTHTEQSLCLGVMKKPRQQQTSRTKNEQIDLSLTIALGASAFVFSSSFLSSVSFFFLFFQSFPFIGLALFFSVLLHFVIVLVLRLLS